MQNEKNVRDLMYEKILEARNEEIKQGNLLKKISDSKKRQDEYQNDAYIYGAYYYTGEKLEQMRKDAWIYLHEKLDVENIKNGIDNGLKLDISQLEKLHNMENKICQMRDILTNTIDSNEKKKFSSPFIKIADRVNGGERNEN